jgi:transposase
MINDERWRLVRPLLPFTRQRKEDADVDVRAILAAVVYVVTTYTPWDRLPSVFGVARRSARYRFDIWTEANLWRQLAVACMTTPHAEWACRVANAAIHYAAVPAAPVPTVPELPGAAEVVDEPARPRHPRPNAGEYIEARAAMNRHTGTAL